MSLVRATAAAFALAAALLPGVARAQTCSFSFGPTALSFGLYDPGATAATSSSGTFTYQCSNNSPRLTIWLSTGNGGSFSPRQMSKGTDKLNYNLYWDTPGGRIWGDGTGGTDTVSSRPLGGAHAATLTVYGQIATGQWTAPGAYSDTITVTLNW